MGNSGVRNRKTNRNGEFRQQICRSPAGANKTLVSKWTILKSIVFFCIFRILRTRIISQSDASESQLESVESPGSRLWLFFFFLDFFDFFFEDFLDFFLDFFPLLMDLSVALRIFLPISSEDEPEEDLPPLPASLSLLPPLLWLLSRLRLRLRDDRRSSFRCRWEWWEWR